MRKVVKNIKPRQTKLPL